MVALDKFVKVHGKTFKSNAQMTTKVKIMSHSDIVVLVLRILLSSKRKA